MEMVHITFIVLFICLLRDLLCDDWGIEVKSFSGVEVRMMIL